MKNSSYQKETKSQKQRIQECIELILNDLKKYKIMLLGIIFSILIFQLVFHKFCPVVLITGYPCPGCGMTRALLALITLHFAEAFTLNPMIYVWFPFILYLLFRRYYIQKSLNKCMLPAVLIGLITIGVYIYRIVYLFPSVSPMTYFEHNLFHTILSIFKTWIN